MKTRWIAVGLLLAGMAGAQQDIGYKSAADAEQKKTLLLRDFHPKSMMHAEEHPVLRAKFPVFDVHQHVNDAMKIEDHVEPAALVARMDKLNIKTIVILTGMWGDKLQHVIDEMVKPYPGRFLVFTQIDWSRIDDPNFSQEMVAQIDDGVGYVIALDDARLRRLRLVDLAAPAEPHAGAVSQRRFHCDHESSRHLPVSRLGYGDPVRDDDETRAHVSFQLDDRRVAVLMILTITVSNRGAF